MSSFVAPLEIARAGISFKGNAAFSEYLLKFLGFSEFTKKVLGIEHPARVKVWVHP